MDFRYIAIEGPIGVGKSSLAERLAARLDLSVAALMGLRAFLNQAMEGQLTTVTWCAARNTASRVPWSESA